MSEIIENYIEETVEATPTVEVVKKSPRNERHSKKMAALVNLLTPLIVVPSASGEPYTKYIIEDPTLRDQIQYMIMTEITKHYKIKGREF